MESLHVRNGLIAGFASGLVTAAVTYATLPTVDEVLDAISVYAPSVLENLDYEALRPLLSLAIKLSGIIALFAMTFIGAIFGWIHEVLDVRLRLGPFLSALASGLLLTGLLVIPNIAMGASWAKTLSGLLTGVTYIIVLAALAVKGKRGLDYTNWQ